MKRAANQSGAVMPSQSARQVMSEAEMDEESIQKQADMPVEVEMKSVSNGSFVPSSALPSSMKKEEKLSEPSSPKKDDKKEELKDNPLSSLTNTQNPLQQLQIVRLLTDLGDRLRQSEKEREILWKEVEICRKQISDISGNAGKNEKSFTSLESQINQREVFVKELVEKQIGLEQQLKDQLAAFDSSKKEQTKLQDKLNSVETAAGSAIVRIEDVVAENSKLSKRVEQLGQDKARLVRKLEVVEEALTQTQEILKAKALVLLTDQSVANRTAAPQVPAWTGDDTLRVSQPKATDKTADSNIASALRSQNHQLPKAPSLLIVSIVTAIISCAAALGAIWFIKNMNTQDVIVPTEIEKSESDVSSKPVSSRQDELMAQAAQIANQIEPSIADNPADEMLESSTDTLQSSAFKPAQDAQDKAVESFKQSAPVGDVSNRIKADRTLPKSVADIEDKAFSGDAYAQHDLAAIYTAGHGGIKVNYAKAASWFEESAHNGSSNAQYNLGVLYHQGLGVKKDTAKAIELYRVASANHHPEALYNLAIAYVEGVGVEYNPQIAAVYFEQSAAGGIVEAAYNLGLLHENGLLGESQPDEAIFWYKIAADKKNPDAIKSLAQLKTKLSMTDEDVSRITQKIATSKIDFLNDDGLAEMPAQVKPEVKNPEPVANSLEEKQKIVPDKTVARTLPQPKAIDPVIVSQIQEQLMRLGLYKGIPNGTMSPVLSQAIKIYQTQNGLAADGQPSDDLLVQMLVSGSEIKSAEDFPTPLNN